MAAVEKLTKDQIGVNYLRMQSKQETLRRPWGILQARDREAQNNNGAKLFLNLNSNLNYFPIISREILFCLIPKSS